MNHVDLLKVVGYFHTEEKCKVAKPAVTRLLNYKVVPVEQKITSVTFYKSSLHVKLCKSRSPLPIPKTYDLSVAA